MTRTAVLASGRGTNLQALIDAQAAGELDPARLVVVLSNVADATALERARHAGIRAEFCDPRGLTREEFDLELAARLAQHEVELLCLAGYMRLLSPGFFRAFTRPILNVHPALLPAFPGLHAQRQAWSYGVKISGATVHFVDEGMDSGPIVAQEAVAVLDDDTSETLAARILDAEHRIYPRAVREVAAGRFHLSGRRCLTAEMAPTRRATDAHRGGA